VTAEDDRFLTLHEIYRLALNRTASWRAQRLRDQPGPAAALEAGVTWPAGSWRPGARRVVASHGGVADQSTADLMVAFFTKLTRRARPTELRPACKRLGRRGCARTKALVVRPFYWAPFVLIGPGDYGTEPASRHRARPAAQEGRDRAQVELIRR